MAHRSIKALQTKCIDPSLRSGLQLSGNAEFARLSHRFEQFGRSWRRLGLFMHS
jgi:hypothetical protein